MSLSTGNPVEKRNQVRKFPFFLFWESAMSKLYFWSLTEVSVPSGDHTLYKSLKYKYTVCAACTLNCGCFHSFFYLNISTFPLIPALIHVPSSGIVDRAASFLKRGSNRHLLSHALCVWPSKCGPPAEGCSLGGQG